MHKFKFLLLLVISALLLSACSKESEDTILMNAKAKLEEAKKLEGENKIDDAKKAYMEALEIYKQYLNEYSASQRAPEVYSTIAKVYVDNLRDYPTAIRYYEELAQKHPASKESKYGMFMVAFIYDEMLKDKDKAKENYKKFLDKYPKDEDANEKMSESAKIMLEMLDENRSIEDIIKNTQKDTTRSKDTVKGSLKKLEDPRVPPRNTNDLNDDGTPKKNNN